VKLTAKVKLEGGDKRALLRTLEVANECANWIGERAWGTKTFAQYPLHRLVYREARKRSGLGAQVVVRLISKVADAYKMDKKVQRAFRPHGAIAYDARILRWNLVERSVSIWTVEGRREFRFVGGDRQYALLATQRGESDLIYSRGEFYLAATCEVQESAPVECAGFLGVDLGIANIASDSDGRRYSGSEVKSVRHRQRRLRCKLQKLHTTSANRRLKKLAGKERRFARHTNHVVSKSLVAAAKGTGRGIAIEDLGGIRSRVTVGRRQRAVLHSWSFFQLRSFLEYKAALAGVPVVLVDPRNSSRECSQCHHVSKSNRPTQSIFRCRACGHQAHADSNAAGVIADRATRKLAKRGNRACPADPQSRRL
jgi:putative transposase